MPLHENGKATSDLGMPN